MHKLKRCLVTSTAMAFLLGTNLVSRVHGEEPFPTDVVYSQPKVISPFTEASAFDPTMRPVGFDIADVGRIPANLSQSPFMIGDFFGPFSSSGVQLGGPGRDVTTAIGISGKTTAIELIHTIIGGSGARVVFRSVGSDVVFLSKNAADTLNPLTVIALLPDSIIVNSLKQQFGPQATYILSQAVPLALATNLPGLQGAQIGNPSVFPGPPAGVLIPPSGTSFATLNRVFLAGPYPGSKPGQDLVVGSGPPLSGQPNELYVIVEQFNLGAIAGGFIFAPQPGDSIGGSKIADNNSPMPRDRIYGVYNHFNHAFGSTNIDLGRFGIEKTFFSGLASIEVRVPFAGTVASSQQSDGSASGDAVFGNVCINLKTLLYTGDNFLLSGGVGLTTPTADDTRVTSSGNEIVRFHNESVHVLPFLGALYAPKDSRWFGQGFIQAEIDTLGNPVTILGISNGRVQNTNFLYLDAGFGYYAYENTNSSAWIRSVVPMIEFHYNVALEDGHFVTDPSGIVVGSTLGGQNIFNLTVGASTLIGRNASLNAGWVTALSDPKFNWELNCALNFRF
jgi:hypothetical protein